MPIGLQRSSLPAVTTRFSAPAMDLSGGAATPGSPRFAISRADPQSDARPADGPAHIESARLTVRSADLRNYRQSCSAEHAELPLMAGASGVRMCRIDRGPQVA
jgi:hypothetical protein